ncbi:hypothetical protein D3C87_1737770 [compost metagenome]
MCLNNTKNGKYSPAVVKLGTGINFNVIVKIPDLLHHVIQLVDHDPVVPAIFHEVIGIVVSPVKGWRHKIPAIHICVQVLLQLIDPVGLVDQVFLHLFHRAYGLGIIGIQLGIC